MMVGLHAHPAHLLDLLYATGMAGDCFLYCEQPDLAETLRALDGDIALMATVRDESDLIAARERLGAQIVELDARHMTPELVAACRARGHRVMAYTQADDAALFRRIIACGVELVNLDHPETWLQVASSSGGAGR